jgi:phosphoserine phosphatase
VKERIQRDQQAGYHTVLLSGNLENILAPFRNDGFDDVIGTPITKDGRRLGADEVEILIEDGKVRRIEERYPDIDWAASKAYADSGYDLPLLQKVGEAIAVTPDEVLREHALRCGWEILTND